MHRATNGSDISVLLTADARVLDPDQRSPIAFRRIAPHFRSTIDVPRSSAFIHEAGRERERARARYYAPLSKYINQSSSWRSLSEGGGRAARRVSLKGPCPQKENRDEAFGGGDSETRHPRRVALSSTRVNISRSSVVLRLLVHSFV